MSLKKNCSGKNTRKAIVTLDEDTYLSILYEYSKGGGKFKYKKFYVRLRHLIEKGLKYEKMENKAGKIKEETPVPVQAVIKALPPSEVPKCCGRPMIDYGDFMACLACSATKLK